MYFSSRAVMGAFYFPSRGVSNTLRPNIAWQFFRIGMVVKETDAFRLQRPGIPGKNERKGAGRLPGTPHPARFTWRER
jgi:hypothetical protein